MTFSGGVTADFDWRQTGPQTWDITFETPKGALALRMGGNVLEVGGKPAGGQNTIMGEYPALYARMADLLHLKQSEVDLAPMIHVADALTLGARREVDAFHF
jgi:D-galactose 1-dehydrogenase